VRYLLQFAPDRRQVASSFDHVRNFCDIAATNRTEIAASLHLQFLSRARARQKLKSATKIAQKIACVNGPYEAIEK